jgi:hypothetical protein
MPAHRRPTREPWIIDRDEDLDEIKITAPFRRGMVPIAKVEIGYDGKIGDEQEANARLIRVAPALLAFALIVQRHLPALEAQGMIGDGDAIALREAVTAVTGGPTRDAGA